jgi:DNA-binding CsgD family transcriptional regulator
MAIFERQPLLTMGLDGGGTTNLFLAGLQKIAAAVGLSKTTLLFAPSAEDVLLKPLIIESSLPVSYVSDFDRARMLRMCPLKKKLYDSAVPQHWHLAAATGVPNFPPEFRALMLRYDIPAGIALPINDADGRRVIFWFAGDRPPFAQHEVNEITMISLHALDAYNALKRDQYLLRSSLSARELEVVHWTAEGKTSFEIGQILKLSDHTVNAYMNKAIKKLDCVNRTQLVAKAIRFKLI